MRTLRIHGILISKARTRVLLQAPAPARWRTLPTNLRGSLPPPAQASLPSPPQTSLRANHQPAGHPGYPEPGRSSNVLPPRTCPSPPARANYLPYPDFDIEPDIIRSLIFDPLLLILKIARNH